jgi:bla regulator protein blaR1
MSLLFATSLVSERIIYALSWTLLHSIWQGAVLALTAGLLLVLGQKMAANARYNLLLGALFLFVLTVGTTAYWEWQQPDKAERLNSIAIAPVAIHPEQQFRNSSSMTTAWFEDFQHIFTVYIDQHAFQIIVCWMLILLFNAMRMGLDLRYLYRVRRQRTQVPERQWEIRLRTLTDQMGLRSLVRLLESDWVKTPSAIGFLKPIILLPVGLLNNLPPEQVEAILLHELAHIRRNDYLVNFIQCLLEQAFFFNPGFLWVSALIRQERENCCDDLAVSVLNNKTHYIRALVAFQEFNLKSPRYAMGFADQKMPLLDRVKRLINHHNYKTLSLMEKISLLAGLLLISAVTFVSLQKSHAQSTNSSKSFSTITFTGDGSELNPQDVYTKDQKGKTYHVKRVDGKIVELKVNDKTIDPKHYDDYTAILKKIDEQINAELLESHAELAELAHEGNWVEQEAKLEAEQAQLDAVLAEHSAELAQLSALDSELAEPIEAAELAELAADGLQKNHLQTLGQLKALHEQARMAADMAGTNKEEALQALKRAQEQAKQDIESAEREFKESMRMLKQSQEQLKRDMEQLQRDKMQLKRDAEQLQRDKATAEKDKKAMEGLFLELVKDKLIKDKSELFDFELNEQVMIVNGKKQSDALHKKYFEKLSKIGVGGVKNLVYHNDEPK